VGEEIAGRSAKYLVPARSFDQLKRNSGVAIKDFGDVLRAARVERAEVLHVVDRVCGDVLESSTVIVPPLQ